MGNKYTIDWWFNNVFIRIVLPIVLTGLITWVTNINVKLHELEIAVVQNKAKIEAIDSINERVISIDNFLRNGR